MRAVRAVAVLVLLLLAGCGLAGSDTGSQNGRYTLTVITQKQHTLGPDHLSSGPLVVAGGSVTLTRGAVHRGLVTTIGGQLLIEGTVDGDLVALGGRVTLTDKAVVTGDLQELGGSAAVAEGAVVQGQISKEPGPGPVAALRGANPSLLWLLVTVPLLAGAAWVLTRLAPRPLARMAEAARTYPVVSGALGLLVLLTAPAVLFSMVLTLLLIPVALVLFVVLAIVAACGLVGLGQALGAQLARRRRWRLQPSLAAALGTAGLVAALNLLTVVPIVGLLGALVVVAVALGAALLTTLGTRRYQPPEDDIA